MAKETKKERSKASLEELIKLSDEKEIELSNLRLRHSQGKLRDTTKLVKVRRELARTNTFIREKAKEIDK